ncbi:MAG: uroporphyrinogen decarboxylase [Chloroflexi bacterium]|nr:uroporphyrinogen decarboxylase [Chloroflexota bacterium]MCI0646581.1 uroporphyrinogen decarboxylase [Chloroflexota bacterium]MCI0726383.1 uroporphyrinogen decarboxylase [Chloroflexota bacterium]
MNGWSKRKRLEAAIAGEAVDRLPVALWRHFPGDDQDAAALAAAHIQWQRDYDWDLVKVSPASSYCLVDWGVKDLWEGSLEGTRTYIERAISEPDDWGHLPVLDPRRGMLATQIEALQLLGQAFGDDIPFIATIFSPLAQAKNLAGEEIMLSHMRRQPQAFRHGLEIITRSTVDFIEAAKETDMSGIYYAIQHASYPLLSPAEYEQFGRPYDEEILAAASDLWLNMLHIHGQQIFFDRLADYPVEIVNWHDRESGLNLEEGLQQIAGAVSGGVSRWSLYQEAPDAALEEARDAARQTSGRRFVLGVGCVAMTNTPLRNLRAMREFVEAAV